MLSHSENRNAESPGPARSPISVLGVVVRNLDNLDSIFGRAAIEVALTEIDAAVHEAFRHVLSNHRTKQPQTGLGMWAMAFDRGERTLPRQESEFHEALIAAVVARFEEVLLHVFGGGSGSRVEFAVTVFPFPEELAMNGIESLSKEQERILANAVTLHLNKLELTDFRRVGIADPIRRGTLQSILRERSVHTLLQPIVCLNDGRVVGYEALSRGPKGSELEFPDQLFGAARCVGEEQRLELLCAELALQRTRNRLPSGQFVTLNLGPDALLIGVNTLEFEGRTDVMVELTEHMPLDEIDRLAPAVEKLRAMGVGFVLDDTGCGFADLDTAAALRPDIVKLCITITRQVQCTGGVYDAITNTVQRLGELGCRILAEGVETSGQRDALAQWPIELAQGWLYSKAAPIDDLLGSLSSGHERTRTGLDGKISDLPFIRERVNCAVL